MQKQSPDEQLAALLRSAREKAGMSQRSMAYRLGTNQTQVSMIENAKQHVKVADLIEWCRLTGGDPLEMLKLILNRVE